MLLGEGVSLSPLVRLAIPHVDVVEHLGIFDRLAGLPGASHGDVDVLAAVVDGGYVTLVVVGV